MMQNLIKISEPNLGGNLIPKLSSVIKSGKLSHGMYVKEFEKQLAAYLKIPYVITVSSGTAALHTALKILNICPQDEVITTPFTFISTASAILMVGATPVFADIEIETFLIDPQKVAEKITKKTKAIIAVDLFGQMADYKNLRRIIGNKKITLIEDASQSLGAKQNNKQIGAKADITTLSFYSTKPLTSIEGGALLTHRSDLAQKAISFRDNGRNNKHPDIFDTVGFNYRMTELEAILLLSQLPNFEHKLKKRQNNANFLTESLSKISAIITPKTMAMNHHIFSQYTIVIGKKYPLQRNSLLKKLKKAKIESKIYYPYPLHLQPVFKNLKHKPADFPNALYASRNVLSIPVHPLLTKPDLLRIVKTINKY